MQFVAYSDIHHDDYNNGITEADIVAVEDQVTQYAIQNQIQHVFFLGDWYRATNPNRSVIAAAEESWKRRSDAGITTIVLVGNHDRWTKSAASGHAFVSAGIYKTDLRNVRVIEDVQRFKIDGIHFLCIPSGYEKHPEIATLDGNPNRPLVVLFHGLVAGSALARGSSASSGMHPNLLRRLEADFIFGGDNHTPQDLTDLLGCPSRYVGAPLQHNWGDRDQLRGFWHVCVNGSRFDSYFIPSKSPRFVRRKLEAVNDMDALMKTTSLLQSQLDGNEGIVELTFFGKHASSLNVDLLEDTIKQLGGRRCRVIIDRAYEKVQLVPGMQEVSQPEDKWCTFVSGTNTKELDPSLLGEMGKWAIQEARKVV